MRKVFSVVLALFLCFIPCLSYCTESEYQVATGAALFEYPTDVLELLALRSTPSNLPQGELIAETKTIQRVTASDASGFKAVLLELLGDYETVITDYTYQSSNGYTSHSIQIERDWSWICSAAILGLVLFCVFRLIGGLLAR